MINAPNALGFGEEDVCLVNNVRIPGEVFATYRKNSLVGKMGKFNLPRDAMLLNHGLVVAKSPDIHEYSTAMENLKAEGLLPATVLTLGSLSFSSPRPLFFREQKHSLERCFLVNK